MDRALAFVDPLPMALQYVELGWHPIPLCWPDIFGECACGRGHGEHSIGKAPLTRYGYQDLRVDEAMVRRWWKWKPSANIGLLLEPSELVVVDLDGPAALEEAEALGLPDTLRVSTGKGWHYYYQRPKDCAAGRATQKGESRLIDILAKGYVVAPPSVHVSGRVYVWNAAARAKLAPAPAWALDFLPKPSWMLRKGFKPPSNRFNEGEADVSTVRAAIRHLEPEDYDLWLHVGFALQTWDDVGNGHGEGFRMWDEWSRYSSKYPGTKELQRKWASFRKRGGGKGLGTLFDLAKKAGWAPERIAASPASSVGAWRSTLTA